MPEMMQYWSLMFQFLRRLKWLFVAVTYTSLFATFGAKTLFILMPWVGISMGAYLVDKTRETQSMDDFSGDRLFFRYGEEVSSEVIPIPTDNKWEFTDTRIYAEKLRISLSEKVAARLPENLAQVLGNVAVTDRGTGEKKHFLRVCVRSQFGSLLTHFMHCASFGQTITAHFFTFVRGVHSEWDVVKFIILSPFTIWSWGIPWLLNRHSIISQLSAFRTSSFDSIDLSTMYSLTNKVVFEELEVLLTEAGLITDEIRQVIHGNIYNNFGSGQQVNNSKFRDVNQGMPRLRRPSRLQPA